MNALQEDRKEKIIQSKNVEVFEDNLKQIVARSAHILGENGFDLERVFVFCEEEWEKGFKMGVERREKHEKEWMSECVCDYQKKERKKNTDFWHVKRGTEIRCCFLLPRGLYVDTLTRLSLTYLNTIFYFLGFISLFYLFENFETNVIGRFWLNVISMKYAYLPIRGTRDRETTISLNRSRSVIFYKFI